MHAEVYIRPVKQFHYMSQCECCQGQVQHQEQDSARQLCQEVISVLSHVQREPRVLESDMSAGAESASNNDLSIKTKRVGLEPVLQQDPPRPQAPAAPRSRVLPSR